MIERTFVDALIESIKERYPKSVVVRPNDQRTIGIPDILAWVGGVAHPWSMAIEAKQLRPLMTDPFRRGRRIGQMLEHPFTGPQISLLRRLVDAGVEAYGLVRASSDTAFRIPPHEIPAKTGNFNHEELVKFNYVMRRGGSWELWAPYAHAEKTT